MAQLIYNIKKKTFTCFLMLFFCLSFCSGLSLSTHIGIVSGVGISTEWKKARVGFDIESSFPGYSFISGFLCEKYGDSSFKDGFIKGSGFFIGMDLHAHYPLLKIQDSSFYAGIDLFAGKEIKPKCFDFVVKGSLAYEKSITEKVGIFLNINYPIVTATYSKGFSKMLFYIPDPDWFSVLTGWKTGFVFYL